MRPISLKINAFGPYTEKVFLDFSLLENQNIFIINGPTGSGKTTILDAMVYALYGKTSGGTRSGEEMRSDYADSSTKTLVEFVFSIGNDQYKIMRSPKQILKKKRGDGTREYPAEAAVFKLKDEKWDCIATKANDIRDWIQRIIGFREEQFLQVMLLPQGEFKKLLLASSAERANIMSELFHTEIYAKLQKKLNDKLKEIESENIRFVNKSEDILESQEVVNFVELEEKLINYKEKNIAEKEKLSELRIEKQKIERRYKDSEKREEINLILLNLNEQKKDLEKLDVEMRQRKVFIEDMKDFSKERGSWQELNNLISLVAENIKQESIWNDELSLIEEKLKKIEEEKNKFLQKIEKIKENEKELLLIQTEKEKIKKYEELKICEKEIKEETAKKILEKEKINNDIKNIEVKITDLAQKEKENLAIIDEYKNIQIIENNQKIKIKERKRRDEERLKNEKERLLLLDEENFIKEKEKETNYLENIWKSLDFLYNNSKAFELAKNLEPGDLCPVCGSKEHPKLAKEPEKIISKDDLEQALRNYHEAKDLSTKIRLKNEERLNYIIANLDKLNEIEKLEPIESINILEGKLKEIETRLEYWILANNILENIKNEQKLLDQKLLEISESFELIKKDLQEKENECKIIASEKLNLEKELKILTIDEIEAKEDELKRLISKEKIYEKELNDNYQHNSNEKIRLKTAIEQGIIQRKNYENRQKEIDEQIKENLKNSRIKLSDFADYEHEYLNFEQEEKFYQNYIDNKKTLAEKIKDAKENLENLPKDIIDHELITKEFNEIIKKYEEQLKKETAIEKDLQNINNSYNNFVKLRQENEELQKKYEMVQALSDLANGGKSGVRGFTFENYVLRAILEEVLIAANERLKEMSQARYSLTRAPVQNGGGGYQGLDLEIFDAFTGYTRPANTLSGGETFLASLSLALGLADIVQSYAGGVHLDTIFVDEGFGTLDPETLEMALKAIIKLQENGRLVGIISHVPELKDRITAKLTVKKSDKGSTAFFEV